MMVHWYRIVNRNYEINNWFWSELLQGLWMYLMVHSTRLSQSKCRKCMPPLQKPAGYTHVFHQPLHINLGKIYILCQISNTIRLSALLRLHIHSKLNTWLQWIEQRPLQDKTKNNQVLGFGASYIGDLTVHRPEHTHMAGVLQNMHLADLG